MKPIPINIAVEDLLSEAVARRLLTETNSHYVVGVVFGRYGNGYLRKTAQGWNNAAKSVPFFLLTDLDTEPCPSALLTDWLRVRANPNMIARVAVREVEAWILADPVNFSNFLGIRRQAFPDNPEELQNPKEELVRLAATSPKHDLKSRIVPNPQSTAKQGRDYNSCLIEFVQSKWSPGLAAENSPSLLGCINRLRNFRPSWQD